ncbi:MAG TPA: hypothetical protein VIK18_07785, partial [Pirellulales bacterium]
ATLTGRGRWIGVVCRQNAKDGEEPTLDVSVDSQSLAGWSGAPLGVLCGLPPDGTARDALAGRAGGLIWRWLLEAPMEFERSIDLSFHGPQSGDRLSLFYVEAEKQ